MRKGARHEYYYAGLRESSVMTGIRGTLAERFHAKYTPEPMSGCWLWEASIGKYGYGQIAGPNAVPIRAHVLSYRLHKGEVPKGLDVMHSCDVRCCVNPDHLSLGTRKQNMADAESRGRIARGFKLPHTTLTDNQIRAIVADPRKHKHIAADYFISSSYVSMLKSGTPRSIRCR